MVHPIRPVAYDRRSICAAPGSTGDNTGCPDKPDEMAYFVRVLKETSALTADQLQTINDQFPRHH
jgi:hypothetical protein